MQHVFLGIFSLIGGTVGLVLPQRNAFPGLVSALAGYTFLIHSQDPAYQLLGDLHRGIGFLLCGVGVCIIVGVAFAFYQQEKEALNPFASPWAHVASFLGVSAGLVIMSASTEEAALLDKMGVGVVSCFWVWLGDDGDLWLNIRCLVKTLIQTETKHGKLVTRPSLVRYPPSLQQ